MRTLFYLILTLLLCIQGKATTYFVAANGSSSNNGTTTSTPWTLAKVNSSMNSFNAGDQILFRRGDIFQGNLIITKGGSSKTNVITFGAYGTGSAPVLSGMVPVTGTWTLIDNAKGIYESSAVSGIIAGTAVKVLTIFGSPYLVGRFPNDDAANGGWLTFSSFTTNSVTDNNTTLNPTDWIGAEIGIRGRRFGFDIGTISNVTNGTSGGTTYTILQRSLDSFTYKSGWTAGYGYILLNSPNALDKFGEWWFNTSNNKVRVCFSGNNPALYNVQVSTVDKVIEPRASNITIRDITVNGGNGYGVWNDWVLNHISFINCTFSNNGIDGIYLGNKNHSLVDSCTFNYNMSVGVCFGYHDSDHTISNSYINHTAPFLSCLRRDAVGRVGYGIFSDGPRGGRSLHAINNTLLNNGYMGIFIAGDSNTVEYNYVDTSILLLDDGGGIYYGNFSSNGTAPPNFADTIRNNISLHAIGAPYGAGSGTLTWQGHTFYCDDNSNGAYVANNTGAFSGYNGLYLHNSFNMQILYNTFYSNNLAQIGMQDDGADNAGQHIVNLTIKHNQLQAATASQILYYLNSDNNNFSTFGVIDSNFIAQPFGSTIATRNWFGQGSGCCATYTTSTWPTAYGFDTHSTGVPAGVKSPVVIRFEYNTQPVDSYVKFCGLYYTGLDGAQYRYFAHLLPYRSSLMYRR